MNRLQKFEERGAFGEGPARVAYVLDPTKLPAAANGFEWRAVSGFRPGDAILQDPALKEVFAAAIKNGYTIAARGG